MNHSRTRKSAFRIMLMTSYDSCGYSKLRVPSELRVSQNTLVLRRPHRPLWWGNKYSSRLLRRTLICAAPPVWVDDHLKTRNGNKVGCITSNLSRNWNRLIDFRLVQNHMKAPERLLGKLTPVYYSCDVLSNFNKNISMCISDLSQYSQNIYSPGW